MLNFGASKPRVRGGPGPPPGSAPVHKIAISDRTGFIRKTLLN